MKKYKIAIIATAPFYYHTPLYRQLNNSAQIDLTVYYCSDETLYGTDIKRAYQVGNRKITDNENLLGGYKHEFLKNYSPFPSITNWPFGLINFSIFKKIRDEKYDAVILFAWTDFVRGSAFLSALFSGIPVLFMTDANVLSESSRPLWKKFLKKVILGFAFKKSAGFLTSGENNEKFYLRYHVPVSKMKRMHFFWGYEYFLEKARALASQREKLRASLGIEKNDFVLLFVGRFSEEKMLFNLLDAYQRIKHHNKKLFLVGDGRLRGSIERHIQDLHIEKVYCTEFQSREKLLNFYALADALVLPSKDETWGMVINEAMCFGLPIIASNKVGAALDLVKHGQNGFIFPVEDIHELAQCIERLMSLPGPAIREFGARSKEIIRQWIFDVDPASQIVELLAGSNPMQVKKYKIAMLATAPFYYHIPLYHQLQSAVNVDFKVYYCSDETMRGEDIKKNYKIDNVFASKKYLLDGYQYQFLKNYSPTPSYFIWPFGLMNFGIFNEIRKNKYDVVILQAWNNLTWFVAFLACLIYKTPAFFMTDENLYDEAAKPFVKKTFKKVFFKSILFKFASGFLTSGVANEDLYKYFGVPQKKMSRMYFSYGYRDILEKAKALKPKRNSMRNDFGISDNDFVMLFVGRMAPEKNLFTFLDAYHSIDIPNKKLIFVGDGPLFAGLQEYVKTRDMRGVSFLGFKDRDVVLSFYNMADVFVLPSISEPWGMVINEAMCFGLPIIVSDCVGAGVDLVKNGHNGFIFPSRDATGLATFLEKLMHLAPAEREVFRQRSFEMINRWVDGIDPVKQILQILP